MNDNATSTKVTSTKVMIIDDHPVVRSGLQAIIADELDLDLVALASSAREALDALPQHTPDVALVDLSLPDMDGLELIRRMKVLAVDLKIVVLTTRTGADDIARSGDVGVHAYLFKDTSSDELLGAIRIVSRGGRYMSPSVGRKADQFNRRLDITAREREVLLWMARGLNNDKISERLDIAPETVRSHIKNILGKMGLESRSEGVAFALKLGLIRVENL